MVEAQAFKDALAQWVSGVTIVTTVNADDGSWKGTTASSFSSLSLEPPAILVCLANRLYTRQLITASGIFACSILNHNQAEMGKLFAGAYPQVEDRFAMGTWEAAGTGCPVLTDASAWVDCRVLHSYEVGDHTIFVGEVQAASTNTTEPIVYHRRRWGRFAE